MRLSPLSFLLLLASSTCAAGESRFSGSCALAPATPSSADGRFALNAKLGRADDGPRTGRFALRADLAASAVAKSTTTACTAAGVVLFQDGFES